MKFKGEAGPRRGSRPIKGNELLRSLEAGPDSLFPWFDPGKHAQLLHEVQSNIPDKPVTLPNAKSFYQAKFELAYFISLLCPNQPDLLEVPEEQVKEAAQKAYKQTDRATADPFGLLTGLVDPRIHRNIQAESIQSIQRRMTSNFILNTTNLKLLFSLKLVAPEKVRWVARGISQNPLEYVASGAEPGIDIIPAAAKLSIIWPQKRGEFLRVITPEHIQQYKRWLKELEREAVSPKGRLDDKAAWVENLAYQQILAAEAIQVFPDGRIQLQAPNRSLADTPHLPQRSVL